MSDDELKSYLQHAAKKMFPMMESSAISITILGKPDPKLCLELGAAILFDKPIIVVAAEGMPIPANLKRCASAIVQGNVVQDKTTRDRLTQAIHDVMASDRRAT